MLTHSTVVRSLAECEARYCPRRGTDHSALPAGSPAKLASPPKGIIPTTSTDNTCMRYRKTTFTGFLDAFRYAFRAGQMSCTWLVCLTSAARKIRLIAPVPRDDNTLRSRYFFLGEQRCNLTTLSHMLTVPCNCRCSSREGHRMRHGPQHLPRRSVWRGAHQQQACLSCMFLFVPLTHVFALICLTQIPRPAAICRTTGLCPLCYSQCVF